MRHWVRAPGRLPSCAGVAAKVARRSRTICQGGSDSRQSGHARDFAPDRRRQLFPRRVDQPVTGADGDRKPAGKGEDPLHRAVEHAENERRIRRRIDAEMGVDDGAKLGRRFEAVHQRGGSVGRDGKDDAVTRTECDGFVAEIERRDRSIGKTNGAQLMLHQHLGAALAQQRQGGLNERRPQPVARDQRPASASAERERLADHGRCEPRRAERRIDVQRGEKKRLDQPLIKQPLAADDFADGLACRRPKEPRQRHIVEHACSRHTSARIENPKRNAAVIEAKRPSLAAREIGKRELRSGRTCQPVLGADAAHIVERGVVAGEQQVIAVVDGHADRGVVVGAAAPAGESGRLVHYDLRAAR